MGADRRRVVGAVLVGFAGCVVGAAVLSVAVIWALCALFDPECNSHPVVVFTLLGPIAFGIPVAAVALYLNIYDRRQRRRAGRGSTWTPPPGQSHRP